MCPCVYVTGMIRLLDCSLVRMRVESRNLFFIISPTLALENGTGRHLYSRERRIGKRRIDKQAGHGSRARSEKYAPCVSRKSISKRQTIQDAIIKAAPSNIIFAERNYNFIHALIMYPEYKTKQNKKGNEKVVRRAIATHTR